jgi:hypothetical protein
MTREEEPARGWSCRGDVGGSVFLDLSEMMRTSRFGAVGAPEAFDVDLGRNGDL